MFINLVAELVPFCTSIFDFAEQTVSICTTVTSAWGTIDACLAQICEVSPTLTIVVLEEPLHFVKTIVLLVIPSFVTLYVRHGIVVVVEVLVLVDVLVDVLVEVEDVLVEVLVDVDVEVEEDEDVVVVEDGQLLTILQNMFNKDWLEEIAENTACAIASGHNFESIFCNDNVRGSHLATPIQGSTSPVLNTRSVLVL